MLRRHFWSYCVNCDGIGVLAAQEPQERRQSFLFRACEERGHTVKKRHQTFARMRNSVLDDTIRIYPFRYPAFDIKCSYDTSSVSLKSWESSACWNVMSKTGVQINTEQQVYPIKYEWIKINIRPNTNLCLDFIQFVHFFLTFGKIFRSFRKHLGNILKFFCHTKTTETLLQKSQTVSIYLTCNCIIMRQIIKVWHDITFKRTIIKLRCIYYTF